jgi:nucleoid DNA-binding protein
MTKADLVDEVAKQSNLTKKETELIVNTIFDSIPFFKVGKRLKELVNT